MGYFDRNIHMNGQGTSFDTFLRLAQSAEAKSGAIGNRTVRVVRDQNGLATTTSAGLKGERRQQISDARTAFLHAVESEYGMQGKAAAMKLLHDENGVKIPLTARLIRKVANSMKDFDGIKAENEIIRSNIGEIKRTIEQVGADLSRKGLPVAERFDPADFGRIERDLIERLKSGKCQKTKNGVLNAVQELAKERYVDAYLENSASDRMKNVPESVRKTVQSRILSDMVQIVDDSDDKNLLTGKLDKAIGERLAALSTFFKNVQAHDEALQSALAKAKNEAAPVLGEDQIGEIDAALEKIKADILAGPDHPAGNPGTYEDMAGVAEVESERLDAFYRKKVDLAVQQFIVRRNCEMLIEGPAKFLSDALGIPEANRIRPGDFANGDGLAWTYKDEYLKYDLGTLADVARQAVFRKIAEEWTKTPQSKYEEDGDFDLHAFLAGDQFKNLGQEFSRIDTPETAAEFAKKFKEQFTENAETTKARLENIRCSLDDAKVSLEGKLKTLHFKALGFEPSEKTLKRFNEAIDRVKRELTDSVYKGLWVATDTKSCKEDIVTKVKDKFLEPLKQASGKVLGSKLPANQKKAFIATLFEGRTIPDTLAVERALKVAPSYDAKKIADAVAKGDGAELAKEMKRFADKAKSLWNIVERKRNIGTEKETMYVGTAAQLLVVTHPEIVEAYKSLPPQQRAGLVTALGEDAADVLDGLVAKG